VNWDPGKTTVLLEEAVSLFQNRQMWKPIGAMVMMVTMTMVMMRRNFNLFLKFAKDLENVFGMYDSETMR